MGWQAERRAKSAEEALDEKKQAEAASLAREKLLKQDLETVRGGAGGGGSDVECRRGRGWTG
eukprot:766506-Hanusia_phi.AAC.2